MPTEICGIRKTIIASLVEYVEGKGYSILKKDPGHMVFYNREGAPLVVVVPIDWPMILIGGPMSTARKEYRGIGFRDFIGLLPKQGKVYILSPDLFCIEGEGSASRKDGKDDIERDNIEYVIRVERGKIQRWMLADFIMPAGGRPPLRTFIEIVVDVLPSHVIAFKFFTIGLKNYLVTLGISGLPGVILLPCTSNPYKCKNTASRPALAIEFKLERGVSWEPLATSIEKARHILKSLKAKS
ncbi:MAG: hypothetical protein F7C07_00605 [Desulfurococcales archaeon]|nr:hypothetical protein [Desulfurococcales archaeon]